jgi:hypothetical protein
LDDGKQRLFGNKSAAINPMTGRTDHICPSMPYISGCLMFIGFFLNLFCIHGKITYCKYQILADFFCEQRPNPQRNTKVYPATCLWKCLIVSSYTRSWHPPRNIRMVIKFWMFISPYGNIVCIHIYITHMYIYIYDICI